jgi:hypothetical protein
MRQIKTVGLALSAVLAMSAVVTASASAGVPEFSGSFAFEATSAAATFETAGVSLEGPPTLGHQKVTCKSSYAVGGATGPKTLTLEVIYYKCAGPQKTSCNTPGLSPGEIGFESEGTLGFLPKTKSVGMKFLGNLEFGAFIYFECTNKAGAYFLTYSNGAVVARLTPTNKPASELKLLFSQKEGVEQYRLLEGEVEPAHLYSFIKIGKEATERLKEDSGAAYTQKLKVIGSPIKIII